MRRGFYSGLEFMLIFNLYYLRTNKSLPVYQNLVYSHIKPADLPHSGARKDKKIETILGAFCILTITDEKILDSLNHIRAGDDFRILRMNQLKSNPKIPMMTEPFNPCGLALY